MIKQIKILIDYIKEEYEEWALSIELEKIRREVEKEDRDTEVFQRRKKVNK